jgi:selenocysteine lyase/cysteine desulfurase
MQNHLLEACEAGDVYWPRWAQRVESLRQRAASLLQAKPSEIALVPNTSTGINLVALGLAWRPGDNVVVLENEFPSNLLPWKNLSRRGVEVRVVPVDPSGQVSLPRVEERIDSRTRLVALSWVGFLSGYRLDLGQACERIHRRGARILVDAIQGLGVFPLDVSEIPIDFLAADGHKWMLGPEGMGIAYFREAHLNDMEPVLVGWNSVIDSLQSPSSDPRWKAGADRYEIGSMNMVGAAGLDESLCLLMELKCHRPDSPVAAAVLDNVEWLVEGLRQGGCQVHVPTDRISRSGILSLEVPGRDARSVRHRLLEAGIVTSVRHGRVRVSTHAYNDADDLGRLVAAMRDITSSLPK